MRSFGQFTRNAEPTEVIDWFDDFDGDHPYTFLSNFYVGEPIVVPDVKPHLLMTPGEYQTGEHLFQAHKAEHRVDFELIRDQPDPGSAKHFGRTCELRPDWEHRKRGVMIMTVALKFAPDRAEAELLLRTGDALLVEGTFWSDEIWGVDATQSPMVGANWLGQILMDQRTRLRMNQ